MRSVLILFAGLGALLPLAAPAADPEFRAAWVTRFEWPSPDQATAEGNITRIMSTLAEHNFNAVLFQIRGQADVHYPSPYEPWSNNYGWRDPGFDPVAFAIEQARANGLEFHAYINTHTMAQQRPPEVTEPQHLYNLHGRPGVEESWVIHDEMRQPVGDDTDGDGYVWLSPGVPAASAWTRRAILHVVETYDVDGIHFDRIRTPGAQYSHDPITEARFRGDGNPHHLDWGGFMREQITRDLRRITGATHQIDHDVIVSAAPFGINRRLPGGYQGTGTESYHQWYQDSFTWMSDHCLDMLTPMIYWDIESAHPYEVLLADFMAHCGDRSVIGGLSTNRDCIAQIEETRRQGADGTVIFASGRIDYAALLAGPYAEAAPIPERPWKTNPTTGTIVGHVIGADGQPVTDAWIRVSGGEYTFLSGADGFFAVLDAPAGQHSVVTQIRSDPNTPGSPWQSQMRAAWVADGEVTTVNFDWSAPTTETSE